MPPSGPPSAKSPSQRQQRVAESIRQAIAAMLTRGDVPGLGLTPVTVTGVRMSPDLKLATAYVMPLGGKGLEGVLKALEEHRREIRLEIAHAVNLKFAPDIRFRADDSFDAGLAIDKILNSPRVKRDWEKKAE